MASVTQIKVPEGFVGVCDWTSHSGKRIPESAWLPLKADDNIPAQATAIRVIGRRARLTAS